VDYTDAGTADSTAPQRFWRNKNSIFHMSPIRSWGYVSTGTPGTISSQGINVSSVSVAGNVYTVTMTSGAVSSSAYGVLVTAQATGGTIYLGSYAIVSSTVFTVTFRTSADSPTTVPAFTFAVLQI
jgi:hypothetical protein